jgi:hypothetical protein
MKIKNYWAPTPKKWRKIGDALLAVALFAQTQEALTSYSHMAQTISIVALAGKFLTNFFAEEETVN